MVLLPHSAFIELEGFYIIKSAEILHDYHNVPIKNTMFVSIMCNIKACDMSENFPIERMAKSQSLLIIQLYCACSTQNAIQ